MRVIVRSVNLGGREFLFVCGKGGVGRTTVSAALALSAARAGKRVLVAMCNTKERLSQLLEVEPIGNENQPVGPGFEAVNMTPETALQEYGRMILRVRALYRAVFGNRFVMAFLRGTPGMDAWSMLGKAYYHASHRDRSGTKRYDLVIVDGPATGHALDMLRVPRVLCQIAPPGLLRSEAEAAWRMLTDPNRSGFVVVSLPEDMPVRETLELNGALQGELGLPIAGLVINGVYPKLFEGSEREFFIDLPQRLPADSSLVDLASAARSRCIRESVQEQSLATLHAELPTTSLRLPHIFAPEFGRAAIETLSARFDPCWDGVSQ